MSDNSGSLVPKPVEKTMYEKHGKDVKLSKLNARVGCFYEYIYLTPKQVKKENLRPKKTKIVDKERKTHHYVEASIYRWQCTVFVHVIGTPIKLEGSACFLMNAANYPLIKKPCALCGHVHKTQQLSKTKLKSLASRQVAKPMENQDKLLSRADRKIIWDAIWHDAAKSSKVKRASGLTKKAKRRQAFEDRVEKLAIARAEELATRMYEERMETAIDQNNKDKVPVKG